MRESVRACYVKMAKSADIFAIMTRCQARERDSALMPCPLIRELCDAPPFLVTLLRLVHHVAKHEYFREITRLLSQVHSFPLRHSPSLSTVRLHHLFFPLTSLATIHSSPFAYLRHDQVSACPPALLSSSTSACPLRLRPSLQRRTAFVNAHVYLRYA